MVGIGKREGDFHPYQFHCKIRGGNQSKNLFTLKKISQKIKKLQKIKKRISIFRFIEVKLPRGPKLNRVIGVNLLGSI